MEIKILCSPWLEEGKIVWLDAHTIGCHPRSQALANLVRCGHQFLEAMRPVAEALLDSMQAAAQAIAQVLQEEPGEEEPLTTGSLRELIKTAGTDGAATAVTFDSEGGFRVS
jgi:hypothetical protein